MAMIDMNTGLRITEILSRMCLDDTGFYVENNLSTKHRQLHEESNFVFLTVSDSPSVPVTAGGTVTGRASAKWVANKASNNIINTAMRLIQSARLKEGRVGPSDLNISPPV
jgi:hypothetical protein